MAYMFESETRSHFYLVSSGAFNINDLCCGEPSTINLQFCMVSISQKSGDFALGIARCYIPFGSLTGAMETDPVINDLHAFTIIYLIIAKNYDFPVRKTGCYCQRLSKKLGS